MQLAAVGFFLCLGRPAVHAFSWGSSPSRGSKSPLIGHIDPSDDCRSQPTLPNTYAMALRELQELESEPLCHRNAARLLVHNCQLIEDKDEATVLTDSGRVARDFVDAFAASLAICDLERGSFRIPSACSEFQESTLGRLPIPSKPELHVSTREIDKCLEGLAQSDSAWNTWVSYRHKALRFCDAARADNEKDEHIRLYQRLTKILSRLTVEVEAHMEDRLTELDKSFERASIYLEDLEPRVDVIRAGLDEVESIVSMSLFNAAETSRELMDRASVEAKSLQELLTAIVQEVTHNTQKIAMSYETALESVTRRADYEAETMMTTLAAAVLSSASLQRELESSRLSAEEVARRQQKVEANMHQLEIYVGAISSRYDEHGERLKQAQRRADQILGTLDSAASSAASFQKTVTGTLGLRGWWPYIYCPLASLVMGSYGLPPSAARNVVLVGLGEMAGFLVSNAAGHITTIIPPFIPTDAGNVELDNASFPGGHHSSSREFTNIDHVRKTNYARAF